MDMIFIRIDLFDQDVGMMLRPGLQETFEVGKHSFVKDTLSVFGRPHQMVVTVEDAVAHSSVRGHMYV